MPLSTIFQLYCHCGGQFYRWRKPEYQDKTTHLPQITDKLYHFDTQSEIPLSSNGVYGFAVAVQRLRLQQIHIRRQTTEESRTIRHCDKHKIITNAQHGFRKHRSGETQLVLTTQDPLQSEHTYIHRLFIVTSCGGGNSVKICYFLK